MNPEIKQIAEKLYQDLLAEVEKNKVHPLSPSAGGQSFIKTCERGIKEYNEITNKSEIDLGKLQDWYEEFEY